MAFSVCMQFRKLHSVCRQTLKIVDSKSISTYGNLGTSICSKNKSLELFVPLFTQIRLRTNTKWGRYIPPKRPVDWLPFEWKQRPKNNVIRQSGDTIRTLEVDRSLPKPGFEQSEELKTAPAHIKRTFSLHNATKNDVYEVLKAELLKKVQRHPMDFYSLEVRIALTTLRIRALYDHVKQIKSKYGRHNLQERIQRRDKMLRILYRMDIQRCNWLIDLLQVKYNPQEIGIIPIKYNKTNELTRLTTEYTNKMKAEKIKAHRDELKAQQEEFLKEKEKTLAWIAEEERALGVLPTEDKTSV